MFPNATINLLNYHEIKCTMASVNNQTSNENRIYFGTKANLQNIIQNIKSPYEKEASEYNQKQKEENKINLGEDPFYKKLGNIQEHIEAGNLGSIGINQGEAGKLEKSLNEANVPVSDKFRKNANRYSQDFRQKIRETYEENIYNKASKMLQFYEENLGANNITFDLQAEVEEITDDEENENLDPVQDYLKSIIKMAQEEKPNYKEMHNNTLYLMSQINCNNSYVSKIFDYSISEELENMYNDLNKEVMELSYELGISNGKTHINGSFNYI